MAIVKMKITVELSVKLQSSLTAMFKFQMSTTFLFWVSSHETQQALQLNKDHCSTAGQRKVQSFSLPFFYSTQHACHLTLLTQKRFHHSATSSFMPKRNIVFKGRTMLIHKSEKLETFLAQSQPPHTNRYKLNYLKAQHQSPECNVSYHSLLY